jgi:hypothetical protein
MHSRTINMYHTYLHDKILEVSKSDLCYMDINMTLQQGMSQPKLEGYELREDWILMYRRRFYVLNDQELKNSILLEMHKVPYFGHPSYEKTIVTFKKQYFWLGMKKEVVYFIVRCLKYQKVKAEHRHPASLLQEFPIPEWKWEVVTMDFITKFPRNAKQHDSIMVVVEKLTKASHFILVKSTHKEIDIAEIYMCGVPKLHGVPKTIVSNRDSNFTSKFWKGLLMQEHPHFDQASQRAEAKEQLDSASTYDFEPLWRFVAPSFK